MSTWAMMMLAVPTMALALSGALLGFARHDRKRRASEQAERESR